MKKAPIFVVWGYGSENIFRNFADFLRAQGHEVLTLPDARISKKMELEHLLREPFILLTSSHFTHDANTLAAIYPEIQIENDFLEILHHAKPLLSVYYPHDLATPLILNEPMLLSAFDLVLWPTPFFGYQPKPKNIRDVGLILFRGEWIPPKKRTYDCVWFFSEFTYHAKRYGIPKTYEKIAPILECGVAIKFPFWPGYKEFEREFQARGATVIPAEWHTGDILRNCRVAVSNSFSGIVPEAAFMGTPVIALPMESSDDPNDIPQIQQFWQTQREIFSALPGVILSQYEDFPRHLAAMPPARPPLVKRFDPQHVLDIILTEAASKQARLAEPVSPRAFRIEVDEDPIQSNENLKHYYRWLNVKMPGELDARIFQEHAGKLWKTRLMFEFCFVLKPGTESFLADSIDSLAGQYYDGWRLSIFANTPSPEEEFTQEGSTVRWMQIPENATPEDFINEHLIGSPAHWLGFFECGTQFEPQLLLSLSDYIAIHPEWRAIYTDEDTIDATGERQSPLFKPDFNLELLRSTDYIGGLFVDKKALIEAGGYSRVAEAEQFDSALRIADAQGDSAIGHIHDVLVHTPPACPRASDGGAAQALREHLARRGIAGEVFQGMVEGITRRIVYHHPDTPKVSIIIPTRNRLELLGPCVETLLKNTKYPNWELLIVDNGSDDPNVAAYYEMLCRALPEKVHLLHYDEPFNYSAMNNLAARHASGDYLLLLNNDTECIHDDWLDAMMSHAQRPDVGIVGARLLLPDSLKVQHAGMILGMRGYAEHVFFNIHHDDPGYLNRAQADQEYSAVTGACQLLRKSLFDEVGGLDEGFRFYCSDIDLCLKVRQRGYRIVWTPFATLVHRLAGSLRPLRNDPHSKEAFSQDNNTFYLRWSSSLTDDPAWNRNLSLIEYKPTIEDELAVPWQREFHDRPRIVPMPSGGDGAADYRCLAPLRALHAAGKIQYVEVCRPRAGWERAPLPVELARMAPDTLFMHAPVDNLRCQALMNFSLFNPEVFRIYGLDDLISNIPADNPAYRLLPADVMTERLALGLKACNRLIVSTGPLVDACRHLIDDIRLVPNSLPWSVWGELKSQRRRGPRLRVGWAGAQQHAGDLRFLREVVAATQSEVDWVFLGMKPEGIDPHCIEFHDYVRDLTAYPAKLASLDLDLALAPLELHPFNEAKSNLRLLEYGILGWPVICTDIFPYQTDNPPVTRLPNEANKWIAAIRERVAEPDALAREGDALCEWVKRRYLLENRLDEWLSAFLR
ncbi:hypothetical protein FACS1894158_14010 [Betaproteobacteria bacterium]|nr:hypothetical protein FACS1894158_14010 [Betaproteobacteria bacterium]